MSYNSLNKFLNVGAFFLLALSIGVNNAFIGYKIGGVSFDRLFQILFFLIYLKVLINVVKEDIFKPLAILIFFMLALYTLKYFIYVAYGNEMTLVQLVRGYARTIQYLIVTLLCFLIFKTSEGYIKVVVFCYLCAFLLAFFQNPFTPFTDWAQTAKIEFFSVNMKEEDKLIYSGFLDDEGRSFFRVSGPYGQVITLSYALVSAAIITSFLQVFSKCRYRSIFFLLNMFILLVAVFSLTRSAIASILFINTFSFFLTPFNKFFKGGIFVLMIVSLIFFVGLTDLGAFNRIVESDESSSGKLWLLIKGVFLVFYTPFFTSGFSNETVDVLVYSLSGHPHVNRFPPHNGLISLAMEYSSFIYIPFLYWFNSLVVMSKCLEAKERMFWAFSVIAYMLQQSFHNNGIFVTDFNILFVLALFYARVSRMRSKYEKIIVNR